MKALREEKDFSVYRLAKLTGLHESSIGLVEKGERVPTIETLLRIALALEIRLSDVIRECENIDHEP